MAQHQATTDILSGMSVFEPVRTAMVTGATAGIGRATARTLARAGVTVVLVGRRRSLLLEVLEDIEGDGSPPARALELDVSDGDAVAQAFHEDPSLADVDLLVNNAGLARGVDALQDGRPEEWAEMVNTNVLGLLCVTRPILATMVRRGSGHIVNLGSVAGRWTYPGGAVYCATKSAVRALSEGMRMDVAGSGVRVTNIEPGLVETDFSLVRFRGDAARAGDVYARTRPLRPQDVADTILWCVQRPGHVNVHELVLYPTDQAHVTMVHRT